MNLWAGIIVLILAHKAHAQNRLVFEDSMELLVEIVPFQTESHTIDTCTSSNRNTICFIDSRKPFGIDEGLILPSYEFKQLVFIQGRDTIPLTTSGMYNPVFSPIIDQRHFSIKRTAEGIRIHGWFSDGAGTYCATWIVVNGGAKRILLTNNEETCFQ
jgi:hypothetical protein